MDKADLGGEVNQLCWWLVVWTVLGVCQVVSAQRREGRDIVRLPGELFTCLRWEFDTPQGLVSLPTQAKRWAVDLSERGEIEIRCGERTWVVRVE